MSIIFEEPSGETITFASGGVAGLGEMWEAVHRDARTSTAFNGSIVAGELAADTMIDEVRAETGVTLENPFRLSFYQMNIAPRLVPSPEAWGGSRGDVRADAIQHFNERYAQLRRTEQGAGLPQTDLQSAAMELVRDRRAILEDTRRRASGTTALAGSLAGGFSAAFTDPTQVLAGAVPVGQSVSVLRTAIAGAVLSGGTEAAMQPTIAKWHEDVGLDYTFGDAVNNTAFAALFGGVLSGGGQAGYRAVRGSPEFRTAKARLQALPDDHALKQILSGKRSDVVAAAGKLDGLELDEAGRAALARAQLDQAADDARPAFVDAPGHRNAMHDADAEQAIAAAADITPPAKGRNMAEPPPFRPGAAFDVESKPVSQQRLDVMTLTTDAATMQYKAGGDAKGVTERLYAVKRWNPILANEMIVWERMDGTRIVADGHQRSGLGRRLVQSGAEERIDVNANVLREADGWSAADVRAVASKKNIAEGSGDVLDTAQAIRDRPDIIDDSLPVSSDHMRQARAIGRLSDGAYDLVRGGVIDPVHGAVIGRYAPREMHGAVADAMVKVKPRSELEAQVVTREAMEAGARIEVQESLFGMETLQMSLLPEKMKLVSAITAKLRQDKTLFRTLSREADRIEAAGNQLDRSENAGRAASAAQVETLLVRLATRRGRISAQLNEAAASVADGTVSRAKAAGDLATSLRTEIDEGGAASLLAEDAPPPRVYDGPDEAGPRDLGNETDIAGAGDEPAVRDPNTDDMFATVPGADGTPVRAADADVSRADVVMKRFKGCVVR